MNTAPRTTTLKQIAHIADVNISTVSRALNDSPLITRETKEKVLAIAQRMNYTPNSLAKGLVCRRSDTIGIILPKIYFLQGPFFSEVLSGIENASVKNGYSILIASASGTKESLFPINLIRAKRADGVLIINEYARIRNIAALKREAIPFVMVNRHVDDPNMACVSTDNVQGGWLATKHLAELGHKRIATVTGNANLAVTHERLDGYKRALKANMLNFDPALVREGSFEQGIQSGRTALEELLTEKPRPTAVFAFSDELAMGAIQAARNAGLRIPEDLAIVGYDNIEFSAHTNPPLTTVAQDPYAIGSASCQMLVDLMNGQPVKDQHLQIPVRLVVRASCGAPPSNDSPGRN